jgi:hypothetical protein
MTEILFARYTDVAAILALTSNLAFGQVIYGTGPNALNAVPVNITTTREFLMQVGNGITPNAPAWSALQPGVDFPQAALTSANDTNVTITLGGTPASALLAATSLTMGWSGTLAAGRLNANVVQGITNDTNVTGSISAQVLTLGWSGTLAAGRLNANVVQGITNDTNVTGSISAQVLTLGWSGTLAAARLNANVVQAITNDTNVTGSITAQNLTLGWSGTLSVARGGIGAGTLTANAVLLGNGTSTLGFATIGTSGRLLIDQGAAVNPSFNAMSGDATITNTGAFTVGAGAITLAKMANLAANSVIGNNTGSSATPIALTQAQLTAMINTFTASLAGDVPASPGGTTTFLRADATWQTPPSGSGMTMPPGGRLTLTSNTPIMTATATAQSTIFYTPFLTNQIVINNAGSWIVTTFSQISLVLDTTNALSGKNYDIFIYDNAGTLVLAYGPAWTNNTTRSAAISQNSTNGLWTNTGTMTIRQNSTTTFSATAGLALYVGSFQATANGVTAMVLSGSGSGGVAGVGFFLFNAYNGFPITAYVIDTNGGYTYSSTTWRKANASANNAISYLDGLGTLQVYARYLASEGSVASSAGITGVVQNWSSGGSAYNVPVYGNGGTVLQVWDGQLSPVLGFNVANAIEACTAASASTFDSGSANTLIVTAWI